MRLRVLLCAYDSVQFHGGPHNWVCRFVPSLVLRGLDVRVCLLSWDEPHNGMAYSILREHGVDVCTRQFADTESNVRWLLDEARDFFPDVFIANNVLPAFFATRYLRHANVICIGVIRSLDTFYDALTDRFAIAASPDRLTGIVFVSTFLLDRFTTRCTEVSARAIPSGALVPSTAALDSNAVLRIAYVGRLVVEAKQVLLVAKALIRATSEVDGVEATIYGDGDERLSIERLIDESDADLVKLAGHLSSSELQARLQNTHVIVLLSDYEGLPMAIMEGMTCGCVPVCLRIPSGIPELVENGVSGILVDDRDDSFVDAIRALKNDPNLWKQMSAAARDRVVQNYSMDAVTDRWMELLNSFGSISTSRVVAPPEMVLPEYDPVFAAEDRRSVPDSEQVAGNVDYETGRVRRLLGSIRRKLRRLCLRVGLVGSEN